jgi:hypothetical protein
MDKSLHEARWLLIPILGLIFALLATGLLAG